MKAEFLRKKLPAILLTLCMILSIVPIAALATTSAAETADFTVGRGETAIRLLNQYKTGTADSLWNSDTKTLTLWGVNFVTTAKTAVKLPAGSTIVLKDGTSNTVKSGDITANVNGKENNSIYTTAIDAVGSLTIEGGTGSLTAVSGSHKNADNGWTYTSGITVDGDFTVKGGNVSAQGGLAEVTGDGGLAFSFGVNMETDTRNKGLVVMGGLLTAVGGEAASLNEDGTRDHLEFSRGVAIYRGNVSVSGDGKLTAQSVPSMAESRVLSNGLCISVGDLFVSGSGEVSVSGAYGAYVSGGGIILDGGKLTAASTQEKDNYGRPGNAIDAEVGSSGSPKTSNAGNITLNGGTLETINGKIYMANFGAADTQGLFTVTGGTVINKEQLYGAKKVIISGGSVQTGGIDADELILSDATLTVREPVRKSPYNGELYAYPAVDVSKLTVNSGTLDAAWDWGEFTPIVFNVDESYNDVGLLVRMPYEFNVAAFNGGTTVLDTGKAGNIALKIGGQLILGNGMEETGADENHRQTGTAPVKFAAAAPSTAITAATIENAKFGYQPGDTPKATARVSEVDTDKYEIEYECWQQFENNQPVAAWYSDNASHGNIPAITKFESGKTYVYSLMLKPKNGYTFTDKTVITVNGQKVSAPFVSGVMYIPAVKTITMPTMPNIVVIDVVEINGVTVNFKNGDKPVFTGKVPNGVKYKYDCEWWELDSKTGAISSEFFSGAYENKITAFEAGKTYHYGVYVKAVGFVESENTTYVFGPDTRLKINGKFVNYTRYEGNTSDGSDSTMWVLTDLTMTPQASGTMHDYKIIEGAKGTWTKDTDSTLKFRANGDFSKFSGIKVDGETVSADKYTAESGSTVITLKKDYLATLSVGKHTLTVVYTDGECSTEFEIKAAQQGGGNTGNTDNTGNADKSPKTGDSRNFAFLIALLFVSSVAATALAIRGKKKKHS